MSAQLILGLMGAGTLVLNILFVVGVIGLMIPAWRRRILAPLRANARLIIFLLSIISVIGTLWMQYADNLAPCLFCWYQRICMYPIALITGIAIVKNADMSEIADYILGLSIFGIVIAGYQHLLQLLPSGALIPCSANDECAIRSVFLFHYITIPWMALSVFAIFIVLALIARKKSS